MEGGGIARLVSGGRFFAVYEGHQEAVMWYAALPELLVFFVSLATLLLWLRWRENGGRQGAWYAAATACAYIWTRTQSQFLVRAAPTEQLLRLAHRQQGCCAFAASLMIERSRRLRWM
jgi:hypothetical protein